MELDMTYSSSIAAANAVSTWSPIACERVKDWLKNCNEYHEKCRLAREQFSSLSYPRRLLDLSNIANGSLKLIDGPSLPEGTRYATLSHCWGNCRQAILLKSRLDAYTRHIPINSLPKTFFEAAEICADLDIRYLWIDSLCIVQDDQSDWAAEAPPMADIYATLYATLAAIASRSDHEGLKRPMNSSLVLPLVFSIVGAFGQTCEFVVQKAQNFQTYVSDAPINRRAWVLQERWLSSRVVHFTKDQIYWQCPCTVDAQSEFADHRPEHIQRPSWWSMMDWTALNDEIDITIRPILQGSRLESTILTRWDKLVEEYTACNLSFQSEKLIAIPGLAKRVFGLTMWSESDYLAGLWRQSLPRSLLWSTVNTNREKSSMVPSWSWASVSQSCVYTPYLWGEEDWSRRDIVEVLAAETSPLSDPFGDAKDGVIRLRGALCEIKIYQAGISPAASVRVNGKDVRFGDFRADFDVNGKWRNVLGMTMVLPEKKRDFFQRTVVFLPVLETMPEELSDGESSQAAFRGLMLERTCLKPGQFRRVGFLQIQSEAYETVKSALSTHSFEKRFYQEYDGGGKYVVELI